jgi:hypothetical protein
VDLAKNGVLKVGDILAYKRNFSAVNLQIEKDVLVSLHLAMWYYFLKYIS